MNSLDPGVISLFLSISFKFSQSFLLLHRKHSLIKLSRLFHVCSKSKNFLPVIEPISSVICLIKLWLAGIFSRFACLSQADYRQDTLNFGLNRRTSSVLRVHPTSIYLLGDYCVPICERLLTGISFLARGLTSLQFFTHGQAVACVLLSVILYTDIYVLFWCNIRSDKNKANPRFIGSLGGKGLGPVNRGAR